MEDEQIIELYCKREQAAVAKTKEKYEPYCSVIAHNILFNWEDSEECVNDTWLHTWNAIPPQHPTRLQAFVGAITRNLSIDKYRKLHTKKRGEGNFELILEELEQCVSKESTDQHIDRMVLVESINGFLKRQTKEKRVVFVRRYWYMDSTKDIANRLCMTQGKVKTILFRMRNDLRMELSKEGIEV